MVKGEYISEIYKWYTEGMLTVNRRYQRKLVWTLNEKQQFINTIMKKYPVPLFLLVNSTQNKNNDKVQKKEIIDGLQRLEAIISFILNKYPVKVNGEYQYFNLSVYPGNTILISNKKLFQSTPVMDADLCSNFLLYQLPISIIDANETIVDDVFKRINSTGRKLSSQDLRQAGIISNFSDLVRIISTHLRGDATEEIVNMNEIADYSLSSPGLNYGLDINKVFWVEQGIISEETLRRSKDEEIIAILCNCILTNYTCGMSVSSLNRLYNPDTKVYKQNESILTQNKKNDIINIFRLVISDLEKIFEINNTTFSELLFEDDKNYNKDIVFIILFLSLAQLYSENYFIEDYQEINSVLNNIANTELGQIIEKSECVWNPSVRAHLVDRIKSILIKHMIFKEENPEWNDIFIKFLKRLFIEKQMYDFKIGIHDLHTGQENKDVISKCVKTLTAMANTKPREEGIIILGICDKESDVIDFKNFYNVEVPKYNDLYISGITNEAIKFYGSIQNFTKHIKERIEKQNVIPEVIQYILSNMDTVKYKNQTLIILKLKATQPLFYDEQMYVRYESHNKPIKNGSPEFYKIFANFIKDTRACGRKVGLCNA